MYKIWVRNVKSQLNNYTEELEQKLTSAYPNYWFSPKFKAKIWDGHHHFLKIPSLKFPTGLLFIIIEYLKENNFEYEIIDERIRPEWPEIMPNKIDNILNGITLRDYQQHAILDAIEAERGIIEASTGSGKSEIAIGITKLIGLPTIFMVHTKDLLYQTQERFQKRLATTQIGIVGDEQFLPHNITIATVQTLGLKLKNEPAETKKFLNSFDILFQDECHHSSAMQHYTLGMYCHRAYYRWGLSATALRRDVLSNMKAMAVTGDTIYTKPTKNLQEEGYLSGIKIEMMNNDENIMGNKWQQIYEDGIVRSLERNSKIVALANNHFKTGKRVMILVRQIAHGEVLQNMLVNKMHTPAIFLHGKHEAWEREQIKDKFNRAGNFVLIASNIFSEGIDIPEIQVLIIASGGKSEWETIQKVGRGLRKKKTGKPLLLIDFKDSSKFLKEHSEERFEIYRKEGFL